MHKIDRFDEVCLGIKELDDQHIKVLEFYNSIMKSKEKNSEHELMDNILKLIEHWKAHFKYEEDLMEQYKYSCFAEHKKEHDKIMDDVSNIEKMYSKGFKFVIDFVSVRLNLWIDEHISHIKGEDKKLAEYLISKGVV